MSGHSYQLKTAAPVGAKVYIGGPWDKYGYVVKHQDSGYHLIRGTGHHTPSGYIWSVEVTHP